MIIYTRWTFPWGPPMTPEDAAALVRDGKCVARWSDGNSEAWAILPMIIGG